MPRGRSKGAFFVHKGERLGTKATIQSYLMIAGTVLGMIIFVVIPLLWIMRWCLFSYKGFGTVKFVGSRILYACFQHVLEILAVSRKHLCVRHWQAAR